MYNEAETIRLYLDRVEFVLNKLVQEYEIVCVNDGSQDETLCILKTENTRDARIKIVDLSRNFGKEAALTAGLDFAVGDAVIPIDADLQNPPEIIPQLVDKWLEDYPSNKVRIIQNVTGRGQATCLDASKTRPPINRILCQ